MRLFTEVPTHLVRRGSVKDLRRALENIFCFIRNRCLDTAVHVNLYDGAKYTEVWVSLCDSVRDIPAYKERKQRDVLDKMLRLHRKKKAHGWMAVWSVGFSGHGGSDVFKFNRVKWLQPAVKSVAFSRVTR